MNATAPNRSLASRLSLTVGLSSAVLCLVVLALIAGLYIQRSHAHMREHVQHSTAFLAESLEYPLWTLDLDSVRAIGEALAQDHAIGLVEVTGIRGETYYLHETLYGVVLEHRTPVRHEGQVIGWVRVGMTDVELQATLWPLVLTGIGLAGLIILLQYLLHALFFRPLLAKPFASLDRLVAAYSAGDYSFDPPQAPYAEFVPLFELLAGMGATIRQQIDDLKASSERLSLALEAANDGLWDLDMDSGETFFSPRYYTMLGYEPGEFAPVYESWRSRLHPDEVKRVEGLLRPCLGGAADVYEAEFRFLAKDGGWRWILSRGKVVARDAQGRALRMVGTHVDITGRKELELRLADQLAFQQALMDTLPYAVFYKGADTRFLGFNTAYEEMFGVRREDLLGKRVLDLMYLPPTDRLAYQAEDEAVIASVGRVQKEMPIPFADGKVHQTLYSVSGFRSSDGSPGGLIGVILDITERKQAEAALLLTQFSVDRASDGILWVDHEGRLAYANDSSCASLGYTREEMLRMKIFDIDPDFPAESYEQHKEQLQRVGSMRFESRHISKDGRIFPVEVTTNYIGRKGRFFACSFDRDITERKQAEEALRQSQEKFSRLFRLSPDSIVLSDLETGRILDVNENFCQRSGYSREEAVGRISTELRLFPTALRGTLQDALHAEGRMENLEVEIHYRSGEKVLHSLSSQLLEIDGAPCILTIARDISENRKMQEMMVQTEKMISVGGIAAGVAHEINNPLGIILHATQNLVRRTDPDLARNAAVARDLGLDLNLMNRYMQARKMDVFIADIQSAVVRAGAIIRHMLDFSRRSESRRDVCDLAGIVHKAIGLAQSDYDLKMSYDFRRIQVDVEEGDGLPEINCTETEIEQVILNLLRNAAQAMAGAEPPVAAPRIAVRLSALPGGVRIQVEDNGPGIPPDVQRRIFEPFFTTKAPGVGTGLGLSVSYFIVTKGHGGRMSVESKPGSGTLFTMDLPTEDART